MPIGTPASGPTSSPRVEAGLEVGGSRARLVGGGYAECVKLGIEALHRGDRRRGRLDRRDLAALHQAGKRAGVEPGEVVGGHRSSLLW